MDVKEHVSLREHLVDQEWFNALLDSSLDYIIAINHDDIAVAACRRLIVEQGFDIDNNDYTSTNFVNLAFMKAEKTLG